MGTKGFADQHEAFREKAKRRQLAIFRESAQRVAQRAGVPEAQGGRMPVDTSFLRNSVAASKSGMPSSASQPPELVLLTVEVGDSVNIGWTAVYAMRQEYGFFGADSLGRMYAQPGKGFLRAQLQLWPYIVNEVTNEVRARFP